MAIRERGEERERERVDIWQIFKRGKIANVIFLINLPITVTHTLGHQFSDVLIMSLFPFLSPPLPK